MYSIGDKIVHPMHGAGIVENIVEKEIGGVSKEYYVLRLPVGSMMIMVPISNCADIGVRGIVSGSRADEVISSLATVEIEMTANWNKRYRENVLRIKSGDLDEVVKVVKGLTVRDLQHGLSTGERKMLHSAKDILISEIVLAKGLTYDAIEHEIDTAMASGMEA